VQWYGHHEVWLGCAQSCLGICGPQDADQFRQHFAIGMLHSQNHVVPNAIIGAHADHPLEWIALVATMNTTLGARSVGTDRGGTTLADGGVIRGELGSAAVAEMPIVLGQRLSTNVTETGIDEMQQSRKQATDDVAAGIPETSECVMPEHGRILSLPGR
jgi:hypothetical protein